MPAPLSDAALIEQDLHRAFLAHEDVSRFLRYCRDAMVRGCMAEGYLLDAFERHEALDQDWATTSWFTRVRAQNEAARSPCDALLGLVVRTEWAGRVSVWVEAGAEQPLEGAVLGTAQRMLGTVRLVQGSRPRDWQSASFGASQLRLLLKTPSSALTAIHPVEDLLRESTLPWMRAACRTLLTCAQP